MIVIDASIVVAMMVAEHSSITERVRANAGLHAGQHLAAEVMSALRAGERRGRVQIPDDLAMAVAELDVLLHPLRPRVWELRHNLTPYDGWHVALAEALELPLFTLDHRIARSPGIRCEVLVPDV